MQGHPSDLPLLVSGISVDPGLAGLLGRRAPRSQQPFMVTFFRATPSSMRAPRASRPLRRRPPKKTNELPHLSRLPGIFGETSLGGPRAENRRQPEPLLACGVRHGPPAASYLELPPQTPSLVSRLSQQHRTPRGPYRAEPDPVPASLSPVASEGPFDPWKGWQESWVRPGGDS